MGPTDMDRELDAARVKVERLVACDADAHAVTLAKGVAGSLWAEVCWSALPCLEAGASMRQALETGLYEWDMMIDPIEETRAC